MIWFERGGNSRFGVVKRVGGLAMRRSLILGAVFLAVIALADVLVWHWAVGIVARETEAWAQARRAEGWVVRMSAPDAAGWPLAARIHVRDVEVRVPASGLPGGVMVASARASIGVDLWAYRHLEIALDGAQRLQLGASAAIPYTAVRQVIAVDLPETGLASAADIQIEGLSAILAPDAPPVAIGRANGRFVSVAGALRGSLEADDIDLPPSPVAAGMGSRIARISLDGALVGAPQQTMAAWRDAGGRLTLRQFGLSWGQLGASGSADFHLDDALQPAGSIQADVTGTAETLDALAKAKLLAPRAAMAAKAVLALLQRPQPDGPPSVSLPLALQDRTLQMGRIPLVRLPEIVWTPARD